MDASDYLFLEQAVKDRVDDARRFTSEHAFRSETLPVDPPERPTPRRCGAARLAPAES
jgi:hypothetical protein